jgi:CRISPR-associated protein (TIGR02584 family)
LQRQGKLIDKVVVIYPEGHQSIRMGVRWLRGGFDKRKIPFYDHPIEKMKDCRTQKECQQFREALETVITQERRQSPETPIWLSVSGGRKTMALYALLAAQEQKVPHVYHTLITDPDLEETLIEEGTFQKLQRKRADELETFLFRDDLNPDQFELFRIPLIFSKTS